MDSLDNEYQNYWETNMFLQSEELDSYIDEAIVSAYYDLSSPDGTQSSKNIVSERNRRKKLNERLYALRAVVPNITKMDKASIVKDAIEHIKSLHHEERIIEAEISELETGRANVSDGEQLSEPNFYNECRPIKRPRFMGQPNCSDNSSGSGLLMPSPIQLLELRVCNMGERTLVVSLSCSKGRDTMVKLCEIFESLKLNIITATITSFSGKLLKTVFLECDDEEKEILRLKIEDGIASLNGPDSSINGPGSAVSS